MAAFTLHHGDQRAEYVEHPVETARKLLIAASEIEVGEVAALLLRVAGLLPRRPALMKGGE